MDNATIELTINFETIISALALIATIVGGIYAVLTSTTKYELSEKLKSELLAWYTETIHIMIEFIHTVKNSSGSENDLHKKNELLSQLSAQIEVGRFYFPNIDKKDHFGAHKPVAYQGYRHINLEFLFHFYRIGSKPDCRKHISTLWSLERQLTSEVFKMIDPRERNKKHLKYTGITMSEGKSLGDYLQENPINHIFD